MLPTRKTIHRTLLGIVAGALIGSINPAWAKPPNKPHDPDRVIAVIPYDASPTYFLDEKTNKPAGFAVDIMDIIAKRAGLHVDYIFEHTWTEMIDKVRNGEVDLIPDLGISEEREKILVFTTVLEAFPVSFFVRAQHGPDVGIGENAVVGVIEGSLAFEKLKNRSHMRLVTYQGFGQGLFDLLSGKIDSFACPEPTLMKLAQESGVEDKIRVTGKLITEIKRGIAVRKDNTALLARLNKAIEGFVGQPEYQRIYVKWYGKPTPYWTTGRITALGAGALFAIILTMALWRHFSLLNLNRELQDGITKREQAKVEREKLISDLQKALAEVKTLSGMLPICSSCKKIRDDKGYWNQIEGYISEHSGAEFSHGLCPDCAKKIYPGYTNKKK